MRQLDEMGANVPARAAGIYVVPKTSDTPRFDIKGGSAAVRSDVWDEIVNVMLPEVYRDLSGGRLLCARYRGVPVYELPF